MSVLESKKLPTGALVTAAFGELAAGRREIAIYLGAFVVAEIAGALTPAPVTQLAGLGGLLLFGGYFLGQYLLYRSMLRRAGIPCDGGIHIFRFGFMAVVIAVALTFAMNLFFVPAILLAARWIAAPCYVVAADRGPIASLGASWEATDGNTVSLSLAFLVMVLAFGVLMVVLGALGGAVEAVLSIKLSFGFILHFLPLLLMGLSVAAYRRLNEDGAELAAVFA